jgi:hypothetical protein
MQNSVKEIIREGNRDLMHANLGDHERLDFASVGDVRSNAQIDHRSTTVNSRRRAIGNFSLNEVSLVFIILQMYHQRDRKSSYHASQLT